MSSKRNYWNACPLRAGFFPNKICSHGQTAVDNEAKGCEWFINSKQDNYCFWSWIRRVSDAEGYMESLSQQEIKELLTLPSSKINITYKEALEKIKQFPEYEELKELFED